MNLKIVVLSGDVVSLEIVLQAKKVLEAIAVVFDHEFVLEDALIGAVAIEKTGNSLPEQTLTLCLNTDAVLTAAPIDLNSSDEKGLLKLKKELGLYTNIRPIKVYTDLLDLSPLKRKIIQNTDFIIFREIVDQTPAQSNTNHVQEITVLDGFEYTEQEIIASAHLAFKAAQKRKKKLTLVHRSNTLETSKFWKQTVLKVAENYPDIVLNFLLIENAVREMIINPNFFDVILTDKLLGAVLSNQASVITGTIGLLPSVSIGKLGVIFESFSNSYIEIHTKNNTNPIATILASALLLEHFGLELESQKVYEAVYKAIELNVLTPDLNPYSKFGTIGVGDFISNYILNKEDLYFKRDNVHLGQSTIV